MDLSNLFQHDKRKQESAKEQESSPIHKNRISFTPPSGIAPVSLPAGQNSLQRMLDPKAEEEQPIQHKLEDEENTLQKKATESKSGMPDTLKTGIENLSGTSMDNVQVHYNSSQPAHWQASAFAQGNNIHLGPGQEKHLPHEAWHVAQQRQGRVKPTMQMKGGAVNDDPALEKEADEMGSKAANTHNDHLKGVFQKKESGSSKPSTDVLQAAGPSWWDTIKKGAGVYLGITLKDAGSAYAKALMRHYAIGGGSEFNPETSSINFPTDGMWNTFMASRPEIQKAMFSKFSSLALKYGSGEDKSESFKDSIRDVRLNQLESMRWTLHGCHRIDISGNVEVKTEGTTKKIIFSNVRFNWIDVGDMHPGTTTEMDNGETVDDEEFTGAGSSYPINIPFDMPENSVWSFGDNTLEKKSGWPDNMSGTSTANRE